MGKGGKVVLVALLLAGCDGDHSYEDKWSNITKVLDCTDSRQGISGGGFAIRGTGIGDVHSYSVAGECRVELEDGSRTTLRRPLAVGDRVHYQNMYIEYNGKPVFIRKIEFSAS